MPLAAEVDIPSIIGISVEMQCSPRAESNDAIKLLKITRRRPISSMRRDGVRQDFVDFSVDRQ
jgi:hypothetical protein